MGAKLKFIYEYQGEMVYGFRCPACNESHQVRLGGPYAWHWNESLDCPTIMPSIMVNRGQQNPTAYQCHSHVTDGKIQFCEDCSHSFRGQTLDLPDWQDD